MEQRPLRLGDIVDDYCPRERRITNHVIVALIGDAIRQTRCTTCEAEHAYKEAKVPKRRKKNETDALYEQVLAEVDPGARVAPAPVRAPEADPPAVSPDEEVVSARADADVSVEAESDVSREEEEAAAAPADDVWFGHRRLIRASLPKTETEPQPRPIPEFTMHQRQTRGSQFFRHGGQGGDGQNRNGFRHGRSGNNQGQGAGQPGQGGRPHRGGRGGRHRGNNKRSR